MTSFDFNNISTPHTQAEALSMQDLNGLLRIHLKQISRKPSLTLPSICFTEIDQAFLIWGWLTVVIFSFAQFSTLSWTTQAIIDAALTGVGIATTSGLTWKLATSESLRWVIFLWAVLMSAGIVVTTYGIFCGVSLILMNLCVLWLGLCVLGYGAMAIGMRSRCFGAAFVAHVVATISVSLVPSCQFALSGLIMSTTLFFFSVVPWDMQASEHDIPC